MSVLGQTSPFPALRTNVRYLQDRSFGPVGRALSTSRVERRLSAQGLKQTPRQTPMTPEFGAEWYSNFCLLRDGQCVVHLDAKIPDRAFQLGVAEKKLDRP